MDFEARPLTSSCPASWCGGRHQCVTTVSLTPETSRCSAATIRVADHRRRDQSDLGRAVALLELPRIDTAPESRAEAQTPDTPYTVYDNDPNDTPRRCWNDSTNQNISDLTAALVAAVWPPHFIQNALDEPNEGPVRERLLDQRASMAGAAGYHLKEYEKRPLKPASK